MRPYVMLVVKPLAVSFINLESYKIHLTEMFGLF